MDFIFLAVFFLLPLYYFAMYKNKKALVLGSGRSGRAAEALLRTDGTPAVTVCEAITPDYRYEDLPFIPEIAIVSPGFSQDHPWIQDLKKRGIPLISELEFGWSRRNCPVIAVTGSNGKSTVVKWIVDMLEQAGQTAIPCGNYGLPVSAAVMLPEIPDWLVVEVSSFQLEIVEHFRPDIGVLLNVLPNHLDRHGDMETYNSLKLRLFENMQRTDTAILPFTRTPGVEPSGGNLPEIGNPTPTIAEHSSLRGTADGGHPAKRRESIRVHSQLVTPDLLAKADPFAVGFKTFGTELGADFRYEDGLVFFENQSVGLRNTYFSNDVLGPAVAAGVAVAQACGLPVEAVTASARAFQPLPHRMELVAEINGVRFIDDSKATNLAGMCAALRMTTGPIHLIVGGRAKETDLSFAKDLLAQQVSRLYLIGEASKAMQAVWADSVECLPCETLEQAVCAAWERAVRGETVLLSPACTSFDQFRSFNERGEVFVCEVNRLKKRV